MDHGWQPVNPQHEPDPVSSNSDLRFSFFTTQTEAVDYE